MYVLWDEVDAEDLLWSKEASWLQNQIQNNIFSISWSSFLAWIINVLYNELIQTVCNPDIIITI